MKRRGVSQLKCALIAAAVMVCAAGGSMNAFGAAGVRYVSADCLNLRKAPGTDSAVTGRLYRGEEVSVISEQNGWAEVKVDGVTAYVASRYLTASKPASGSGSGASQQGSASQQNSAPQRAADLPAGVSVSEVSLTSDMKYAGNSAIHSGSAVLYRNSDGAHGDTVVCVNAGHGTKGGESVKTLSHPDGTAKVTGGTNAAGAVKSMAVSSGMSFSDGTPESSVNLETAQYLRAELLNRGFSVLMIREGDDVQLDNIARTVLANRYADCHVAIHFDSTASDKGAFFMSVPDALKQMEPVASTWKKSEAFGTSVIGGLKKRDVKIFSGGSMDMDLTQTAYSSIPSIDLELGDKKTDHSSESLKRFAQGIADGIETYFGT